MFEARWYKREFQEYVAGSADRKHSRRFAALPGGLVTEENYAGNDP